MITFSASAWLRQSVYTINSVLCTRYIRCAACVLCVCFSCVIRYFSLPVAGTYINTSSITGVHTNQDQIWLAKIGKYMGFFMLIAGPDYYGPS